MADKELIEKVQQAIDSAKERKFLESVEVAINLKDVDLTNPKNRINEEVILPHGRGKDIKIAVFGSGELAIKARKAADLVIASDEIDTLVEDKKKAKQMVIDHDFFVAEAPLMPIIGKRLGIYLGTRGKMPKPIPPQADPTPIVKNLRNTVRVRSKERKTFHVPIGTKTMTAEELADNLEVVIKRLESKLERGRMNIQSMYVKTTMGPAVKIM
ncbi:50S ribosomal protein L1 [[Eubacterium] cellulosolvens]